MAKKKRGEIPLAAIPARAPKGPNGGKNYPLPFRQKAVEAMRSRPVAEVARELGVSGAVLYTWRKALDPFAELRQDLEAADAARLARLEQCAFVLEHEGPDGARCAAAIRAVARGDSYIRIDVRPKESRPPRSTRK